MNSECELVEIQLGKIIQQKLSISTCFIIELILTVIHYLFTRGLLFY